MKKLISLLTLLSLLFFAVAAAADHDDDAVLLPIPENQNALEFVGQFNNTPTTSLQFGYLSTIEGLNSVFSSSSIHNETTARFTFVTNATTDRVIINGPFKIVNRTGTTTVYLNSAASDFTNPASFSQGTPIQVSSYRQQVVLNTLTNAFTTVHMNTITSTEPFTLDGVTYVLGKKDGSFRTTYSGQSNAAGAVPGGWFAGYAVGVK
jgi:hypothetical protein